MKKTRKKLVKKFISLLTALTIFAGLFSSAFSTFNVSADQTLSTSSVSYASLNSAYSGVFQYTTKGNGNSGELVGMAIKQNSDTGTYIAYPADGSNTGQLTTIGIFNWSLWFEDHLFYLDGEISYCFDYGTSASGTRQIVSWEDLGLAASYLGSTDSEREEFVINLAKAAYGLTYNNFTAITSSASDIATGYSYGSYSISQSDAQEVLEDTSTLANEVKQLLVQNMIWVYMNDIETYSYHSGYKTSGTAYDKDGNAVSGYTGDTISITAIWDMEELYEIGLEAYAKISSEKTYEYFLEYGESVTLTGTEADDIWTIYEEYDYLGSSAAKDVFTVTKNSDGSVTIKCVKAVSEETYYPSSSTYLYASDVSAAYSASCPYDSGGSGQFIVNVEAMRKIGVRIGTIGTGYLTLKKGSSVDEDWVSGNDEYSLSGAVYYVYSDSDCTEKAGTLITTSDGSSNTLELAAGTYYIKEITASSGYQKSDTVYEAVVEAAKTKTITCEEPLDTAALDIVLHKVNEDGKDCGGMEGVIFKAVYSWGSASVTNYYITDSEGVCDLSDTSYLCTENGTKDSTANNFPADDDGTICVYAGTVTVSEYASSEGYIATDDTLTAAYTTDSEGNLTCSFSGSSEFTASGYVYNLTIRGGVTFAKLDSASLSSVPQGDAALEGAKIAVINDGSSSGGNLDGAVYMTEDDVEESSYIEYVPDGDGDGWYETGEVMLYLYVHYADIDGDGEDELLATTDGNYDGECLTLPYGSYHAEEVSAPAGYLLNTDWETEFEIAENGAVTDLSEEYPLTDEVIRGGVSVQKKDLESLLNTPVGGASLENAVFTVINRSDEAVYVTAEMTEDKVTLLEDENGDGWYETGEAILTLTTDASGYATMDGNGDGECYTLPYGTYLVLETSAPMGYLKSGVISQTFCVSTDGEIYVLGESDDADESFYDQVMRGDFKFTKKNEDGEEMANVLFKITSDTTGETHYFVTDENGYFTTSWDYTSHTIYNANKNDEYVTDNGDGTYTVDEASLNSAYGIWFGTGTVPDSDLGALPYDTYTVEEIKTSANEGYTMKTFTVTIAAKDTGQGEDTEDPEAEIACLDLDTIYNSTVDIRTDASNYEDGSQFAPASDEVAISDSVVITGAKKGREYTLTCILYDAETKEVYTDASGNTYSKSYTITGKGTYLEVEQNVIFYDVDLTGMEGGSVVIFTYVYDSDGNLLISEEDLTDRDETIYIYGLKTLAADAENGTHVSDTAGNVSITDSVSLTNLKYRTNYTVYGVLCYAEDFTDAEGIFHSAGEIITDAEGDAVTASSSFRTATKDIISEDDGSAVVCAYEQDITFTFDSSHLDGAAAVAYVYLYENGAEDTVLAWEEDIENEDETIRFPKIETQAIDAATEDHSGTAAEETAITDKVIFENLLPGHAYRLTAAIYDGEDLLSYTSSVTFTLNADGTFAFEGDPADYEITSMDDGKQSADGWIYMTIEGISAAQGDTYTVYEMLEIEGTDGQWYTVSDHCEADDEDQTIHYPKISTQLKDSIDTASDVLADEEITLIDLVSYENLIPGYEYTVTGTLYDKETGEPVHDDEGNIITESTTFIPKEADGTVKVVFTFSGVSLAGKTIVAFEVLSHNDVAAAVHADIEDEAQTVFFPDGFTTLTSSSGEKSAEANEKTSLIDTITYENLIAGQEYTVYGVLMDKETGKALLDDDGKEITAQASFTAKEASGTVEAIFLFSSKSLEGTSAVAFEYVYNSNGKLIYAHEDIEDGAQTVDLTKPDEPETGDLSGHILWIALGACLLLLAAGAIPAVRKTRKNI